MASLKEKHILIIDDAADVRLLARKVFETDGAIVLDADGCDSGLKIAREKNPQLIILDLEMPGRSGFDFLTDRKKDPVLLEIPVLILSGKNDRQSISKAIALGASDYMLKPFRAPLLLQKTRKTLRLVSFLVKKLKPDAHIPATLSLNGDIVGIHEGGCQLEASVKLGSGDRVKLVGRFIEDLGLHDVPTTVMPIPPTYANQGLYLNHIGFVGMNEERAKKVRKLLKDVVKVKK